MVKSAGFLPIKETIATCFSGICKAPDPSNAKVRQLMDAACRLFLAQPYDAVSTDAIAREAKVSKATLYAHFSSKEALFAALVEEQCTAIANNIWTGDPGAEDIETVLKTIARNFIAMFVTGTAMELYRVIVAEVPRFPELGRTFFAAGPQALHRRIASFLGEADAAGLLCVPDPRLAAVQFVALISGDLPMHEMLGLEKLTPAALQRQVDSGIALFLSAYAASPTVPG